MGITNIKKHDFTHVIVEENDRRCRTCLVKNP
jgi:hypothetical protein